MVLFGFSAEPLLSLVGRSSIALGVRAPGYVAFVLCMFEEFKQICANFVRGTRYGNVK